MLLLFWNGSGGSTPPVTPPTTTAETTRSTAGGTYRRRYADPHLAGSERDRIAAEFRAIYAEIYGQTDPATEIAEQAAALVAEYTPTRAPDFPPPAVVDWAGLVEDTARLAAFRDALMQLRRQVEMARADDEDETLLLLM